MSFTYSGCPAESALDAVRFAIGDTNKDAPILQDEEICYIISTNKTQSGILAAAFRQAATLLGIRATKRTLGPQSEDTSARLAYFKEMADKYERGLLYAGIPPLPNYSADKVFDKGMMSNEE